MELPVISFNADRILITEGGEAQLLTFDLSEPAPAGGLTVKLKIDDPDGEGADTEFLPELISNIVDFGQVEEDGVITASLTIAEGATSATFGISAIADGLDEGNETYSLTLLPDETYIANPTTITTTIEDNMTSPTVSITPETLIATEGETFSWNFSLDTPAPSGGLSLFLPITVNNDPAPGDVEYNIDGSENIADFEFVTNNDLSVGFNLTIAEGATEATLVSEAVADDITETDESFTTVIADGVDYQASEQNEVTTIITELPVVSLVTSEVTAAEGDTFTWDFSLNQPAPEGGLTLFLPVTDNNDPAPGDVEYNIDGSSGIADFEFVVEDDVSIGFNLTIAEGATEATLVSEALADDVSEETEIFTTVIADGTDYRANPVQNEVTTTISDADTSTDIPVISVFAEPTEVEEGSQLLWNFSLSEAVGNGGLTVALDLVEDTDPLPGDISYFVDSSENITDFELIIDEESGLIEQALVTLAEGATEATLVNDIIADNATEGEESVSFALAESLEYSIDSEENAASFTILDTSTDIPTVSITPESVSVTEGETFSWNISLDTPAPEGGLALSLPVIENNDPAPGDVDYNIDGSSGIADFEFVVEDGVSESFNITIAEGETEATVVSQAISDDLAEEDEIFTTALAEGDGYLVNPDQNQVTTTISDADLNPTVDLSPVFGTIEADTIELNGSGQLVFAGDSSDLIDASVVSGGGNRIYGGNGDDTFVLGESDRIFGGPGSDRIFATSGGNNTITGGAGADQFWIATASIPESSNTITDFTLGEDVIGIAGLGVGFDDLTITQTDADTLITANDSDLAVLSGVSADSLTSDNFAFG